MPDGLIKIDKTGIEISKVITVNSNQHFIHMPTGTRGLFKCGIRNGQMIILFLADDGEIYQADNFLTDIFRKDLE